MINIKADKDVKESAQKVARDLGLPLSTIINAYLKEFVRNRSISFSAIPRMTPALEQFLGGVESDIRKDKKMSKNFLTAEEANAYLDEL